MKRRRDTGSAKRHIDNLHNIMDAQMEQKLVTTSGNIQSRQIRVEKVFDTNRDSFTLTTQMVKRIGLVFSILGKDVECNFNISAGSGLDISGLYHYKTAYVTVHLDKSLFATFDLTNNVIICLNAGVLSKAMGIIQRFKPQKLTFKQHPDGLQIIGTPANGHPSDAIIYAIDSGQVVDDVPTDAFTYHTRIRVCSKKLEDTINAMPSTFTIRMDAKNMRMMFTGHCTQSRINIPIPLTEAIISEVVKYPDVLNYEASFIKSYTQLITKGAKLSKYAFLSIQNDCPLCVSFIIDVARTPDRQSELRMYLSSKYTDDNENKN